MMATRMTISSERVCLIGVKMVEAAPMASSNSLRTTLSSLPGCWAGMKMRF